MIQPRPSPDRRAKVNALAEHLADGLTVREARGIIGISHPASRAYFATVCNEVGSQGIGTWRFGEDELPECVTDWRRRRKEIEE